MTIAADTKLGRYKIAFLIGTGGMDEVYLAQNCPSDSTACWAKGKRHEG